MIFSGMHRWLFLLKTHLGQEKGIKTMTLGQTGYSLSQKKATV